MQILYTASQIISYPDESFSIHWLVSARDGKSGIGIKSMTGSARHTIEYKLKNYELYRTLLPSFEGDELIWSNESYIEITDEINETLWETSTYICIVDNDTLVEMQQWLIRSWIPKNPVYSLFQSMMMPSSTADLFSSNVIAFLTSKDTSEKVLIIPPKYQTYQLNSSSAMTVDYEIEKADINRYFSTLSLTINSLPRETIVENTKRIISMINSFETIYFFGYQQPGLVGYWKFNRPVIELVTVPIKITPRQSKESKHVPISHLTDLQSSLSQTLSSVYTLNPDLQIIQPVSSTNISNRVRTILIAVIIIIIIILIVFALVYLGAV